MKIVYSQHCLKRCSDRSITKEEIHFVLQNPADDIYDEDRDDRKCYGRVDSPLFQSPLLLVVYKKKSSMIKVITVMWQDLGGLREVGFDNI